MRVKKIKLECFGEEYSGFITVKRMTDDELDTIREKLGLYDIDPEKKTSTKENVDFMRKTYAMAKPYLVSAEVTRVLDGEVLDLEGLEYETELATYRADVSKSFLGGWAMGNAKGQQPG